MVQFDTLPTSSCDGGACEDATRPDVRHEAADGHSPGDGAMTSEEGSEDAPKDVKSGDGNPCASSPDGGTCGVGDSCNEPPLCVAGVCQPPVPMKDNTVCGIPKNKCWSYPVCSKGKCQASTEFADGYQWPGAPDDNSRCCKGEPVETTSVNNCGVCGIVCRSGQKCSAISGYYFCTGCGTDNGACWSDCCSGTDSPSGHCTPSSCTGDTCKSPDICPKPSHCVAANPVVICTYD